MDRLSGARALARDSTVPGTVDSISANHHRVIPGPAEGQPVSTIVGACWRACLRLGQNLTQRNRRCSREVVVLVGKLNAADPDDQRKEGQQDIEGKLER